MMQGVVAAVAAPAPRGLCPSRRLPLCAGSSQAAPQPWHAQCQDLRHRSRFLGARSAGLPSTPGSFLGEMLHLTLPSAPAPAPRASRPPVGQPCAVPALQGGRTVGPTPGPRALLDVSGPAAAKWALRMVSFYALVRLGVAKETKGGAIDNVHSYISKQLFGVSDEQREREARKAAVKWKETTKGTLQRKLRVPSVSQGRKLLNSIAAVLSEDDLFIDVASHKGCQVRRESAHSQSVCCYNVRALFDELPTPHLEVEITVFPAGPLTAVEYQKAQKLEAVLRKGNSI